MWLAAADPQSRNGIVAGWVTTDRGSGIVFAEEKEKHLEIDAQLEYGRMTLKPGDEAESELFAIGYFDDVRVGMEAWADAVAKWNKIKLPPQPCGYCTWYHAGSSNEKAMVKQTEIAAKELAPYGFNFLQIDDGWQDGVSQERPAEEFYPRAGRRPLSVRHEEDGRHDPRPRPHAGHLVHALRRHLG